MGRFAIALLLLLLPAGQPDKPHLEGRAFPRMSNSDLGRGCSSVLLTIEIKGPETAEWYCPAVEWSFPDGTRASEESDCAPFEERDDFPRIWRRRVCAPPGEWKVAARLSKSGHVIAMTEVEFEVH